MKRTTLKNCCFSFLLTMLGTAACGDADAYDALKAFQSITLPKSNCPYGDFSTNVMELSDSAVTHLKSLKAHADNCKGLAQNAQAVEDSLTKIFDTYRNEMGVGAEGDTIIINCKNYPYVFEIELKNAVAYVSRNQQIPADNFFSDPAAMNTAGAYRKQWPDCKAMTKVQDDGDTEYNPQFMSCMEEATARRMYEMKKKCDIDAHVISKDELANQYKHNIETIEVTTKNIYQGLSGIFKNLMSGECNNKDQLLKEAFKSTAILGSSVSASLFAGPMAGNTAGVLSAVGAEVITQFVDYLDRLAKDHSKLAEIEKNESFENAACLFLDVQDSDCNKYNLELQAVTCRTQTPLEKEEEAKLLKDTKDIFQVIDTYAETTDFGVKAGPEGVELLKRILSSYDVKTKINEREEIILRNILTDAIKSYDDASDLKKMAALVKVRSALGESQRLIALWEKYHEGFFTSADKMDAESLFKSGFIIDAIKNGQEIDSLIAEKLKILAVDKDYLEYIKDYVRSTSIKNSSLNRIITEGLARRIIDNIDKSKIRNEGDIRRLSDLTSAMVEMFRKPFKQRLKSRYRESFSDAYRAEQDLMSHNKLNAKDNATQEKKIALKHLDSNKDEEQIKEIKNARRVAFGYLRNTVKDCIATTGMFFMKRHSRTWYNYPFVKNEGAANLNIDRSPHAYLKACKPFLCDEKSGDGSYKGIPLPYLKDAAAAPTDFGKYQCRLVKNFKSIYDQMEQEYIDHGKICGKTISEITNGGKSFDCMKNSTDKLEALITKGGYVENSLLNFNQKHLKEIIDDKAAPFSFMRFQNAATTLPTAALTPAE
ncbi:MAG: hypothetical protein HQK50_02170 [Oligoflexia bacterium]|nr:hypothetical protein [Oligoflexia bacterium]